MGWDSWHRTEQSDMCDTLRSVDGWNLTQTVIAAVHRAEAAGPSDKHSMITLATSRMLHDNPGSGDSNFAHIQEPTIQEQTGEGM